MGKAKEEVEGWYGLYYYCECGRVYKSDCRYRDHLYQQPPSDRENHRLRRIAKVKRDAHVVSILEKIGYTVKAESEIDLPVNVADKPRDNSDHAAIKSRIRKMPAWDEKLLEHTRMRISTMSERALQTRVGKIKDKEKMIYFAKVLMETGYYPAVLESVLEVIKNNGW